MSAAGASINASVSASLGTSVTGIAGADVDSTAKKQETL